MSAKMFNESPDNTPNIKTQQNTQEKQYSNTPSKSKIPLSSTSPSPIRKTYSLRLKGERSFATSPQDGASSSNYRLLASAAEYDPQKTHPTKTEHYTISSGPKTTLRRGRSFIDTKEDDLSLRREVSTLSRGHQVSNISTNTFGVESPQEGALTSKGARNRPSLGCNLDMEGCSNPETNGGVKNHPQGKPKFRTNSLSLTLLTPNKLEGITSPRATPCTPPVTPNCANSKGSLATTPNLHHYHGIRPGTIGGHSSHSRDWDMDSLDSTTSNLSIASSCDHASVARNGTTFSGRSMKYVFHCNQHSGATGEDYLTPTQRAHKQVRKLKTLLQQAQKDLEQKDSDILKLTKEVVELRLYKAALGSPEDKSNSSDAITVRENHSGACTNEGFTPENDVDGLTSHADLTSSYTDSGHFDDTNMSVASKDDDLTTSSPFRHRAESVDKAVDCCNILVHGSEHDNLILEYEKRFKELIQMHEDNTTQLKHKQNDKVEELLQRIADINERYWKIVPELDTARDRIKELENQLEITCQKLEAQEETQKDTYLHIYSQGKEAAKLEQERKVLELAAENSAKLSVPELLQELQVTRNELENIRAIYRQLMEVKSKNKIDPEITLQFLKSAVYYFLTDKENSQGHLKAIQSILGFTSAEITNIEKSGHH